MAPRHRPRPHNKEAPEQQAAAAIGVRRMRAMLRWTLAALLRTDFLYHREEASQVPVELTVESREAGKAGLGGAAVGEEEGVECGEGVFLALLLQVCLRAQTSEIMILPNQQ
ncbi:hypothetical protein NEUTE2DRAFT_128225 [Neurospora tetrasperma FGSC 2509]|nr:hypothetical protein NEUTE2DRAFT_128225 [Neurospora tetrasperma FGSC 2509]